MQTFLSVVRIFLAVLVGWFVIVLWFLLLTVKVSPLNQLLDYFGIIPLMTHSNADGGLRWQHFSLLLQSVLVFASGGFASAFIAKSHEYLAAAILSVAAVVTCVAWDSYIECRVYQGVDLLLWFNGIFAILISAFIIDRRRLLMHFYHRVVRRPN